MTDQRGCGLAVAYLRLHPIGEKRRQALVRSIGSLADLFLELGKQDAKVGVSNDLLLDEKIDQRVDCHDRQIT